MTPSLRAPGAAGRGPSPNAPGWRSRVAVRGAADPPVARDPVFWGLAAATLAVHLVLLHAPNLPGYHKWWVYIDEGYRLYPPLRLLEGQVLFRDLFTPYPPLSYWLHAAAYEMFGVRISSVRVVLALSQLATTLTSYAIARRLMGRGFATAAALLTVAFGVVRLNMGYSGWYVVPLSMLTVLFLFRYLESEGLRRRELLLAGAFAGLVLATKLRDGAWVVAAGLVSILVWRTFRDFEPGWRRPARFPAAYAAHLLLPLLVLAMLAGSSGPREHLAMEVHVLDDVLPERVALFLLPSLTVSLALLLRQICFRGAVHSRTGLLAAEVAIFGAGVAAITLPWLLYYLRAAGAEALYEQVVTVPMAMKERLVRWYLPPMRSAFVAAAAGLALVALAAFPPADRWRVPAAVLLGAGLLTATALYALGAPLAMAGHFVLLPAASGIALLVVCRHWRRPNVFSLQLAVLGVFNGTAAMSLHPWADFNHWLWAAPPAFVIACLAASRAGAAWAPLRWIAAACVAVIVAVSLQRGFEPVLTAPRAWLRNAPRADVAMDPASARQTQRVVDFVARYVPEDEAILEVPGSFYSFVTGHPQAARLDYFWILDAATWDEAREIETIRRKDPTYAFVREEPFTSDWRALFPAVARFVDASYVPVAKLGYVTVLRKRSSPLAGHPLARDAPGAQTRAVLRVWRSVSTAR